MCQKDDASLFRVGKAQNKMEVSVSLTMAPGTAFVTGVLLCLGTCFSAPRHLPSLQGVCGFPEGRGPSLFLTSLA